MTNPEPSPGLAVQHTTGHRPAAIGGILGIVGAAPQKKETAASTRKGIGYRVMLASYGFMTASMLVFAARGFL